MVDVYEEVPDDEPQTYFYNVWLPYACYGVVVDSDDTIASTPPIARWATGRDIKWFTKWVEKKGGTVSGC